MENKLYGVELYNTAIRVQVGHINHLSIVTNVEIEGG